MLKAMNYEWLTKLRLFQTIHMCSMRRIPDFTMKSGAKPKIYFWPYSCSTSLFGRSGVASYQITVHNKPIAVPTTPKHAFRIQSLNTRPRVLMGISKMDLDLFSVFYVMNEMNGSWQIVFICKVCHLFLAIKQCCIARQTVQLHQLVQLLHSHLQYLERIPLPYMWYITLHIYRTLYPKWNCEKRLMAYPSIVCAHAVMWHCLCMCRHLCPTLCK